MLRALLIEDNPDFRHSVTQTLNDYFYDSLCIYQASDCTYAGNLLRNQQFDLVLLDIKVSGENGLDLIPLIRAVSGGSSNIIVMSNFDISEYEEYALNAGADGYIAKCSDCFLILPDLIGDLMMQKTDYHSLRLH